MDFSIQQGLVSFADRMTADWTQPLWAIFALALLVTWSQARLYRKALTHLEHSKLIWDDALLRAIHTPLRLFFWLLLITLASLVAHDEWPALNQNLLRFFPAALVVLFFWAILRFIDGVQKNVTSGDHKIQLDEGSAQGFGRLARALIYLVGTVVLLHTLGVNMTGLLAVSGVGTILVGMAGQNFIANLFGGMMLYFDRPFKVGDWIRSPDKNIEGVVEDIGWRLTRIRTFERRPIYVPNSLFLTLSLENPSRMTNRRFMTTIGVRYQDIPVLDTLLPAFREMADNHPSIDHSLFKMIHLLQFGPSSADIGFYMFTKTTDWGRFRAIQEELLLSIHQIIREHGAQIAFPTSTLMVPEPVRVSMNTTEPLPSGEVHG